MTDTIKTLVLDIETKEVPDFPEIRASGDGRLFYRGELVRTFVNSTGYERTKLSRTPYSDGRKGSSYSVHRLVASAWVPNLENLSDINHKDGNKSNNNISNLEWVTRKENLIHAMRTGLHANPEKAVVGWNPDTGDGWWFISQAEAARHGFTQANLSHVVSGKRKKCKGHHWEFA